MKEQFTTYKGAQIWTFESLCERGIIPMFFGSTLGTGDIRLFVVAESYISHDDCANQVKAKFDQVLSEI